MTYDQYIDEFKRFSQTAIINHAPNSDQSLQPGSISRFQSFMTDFSEKMQGLNDVLVAEGNRLLTVASENGSVDSGKLKSEIFNLGKQAIGEFVSRYKPK